MTFHCFVLQFSPPLLLILYYRHLVQYRIKSHLKLYDFDFMYLNQCLAFFISRHCFGNILKPCVSSIILHFYILHLDIEGYLVCRT